MKNVVLQPCANRDAKNHFQKTIKSSIGAQEVVIWGVKKNNKEKWDMLQEGDLVLFSANRRLFFAGAIVAKMASTPLAKVLWKVDDEDGQTWEYIYFMFESKAIDIDVVELNRIMGYKDNNNIQSFQIISDPSKVAAIRAIV